MSYPGPVSPNAVVSGDFNQDGVTDFVVRQAFVGFTPDSLITYLGVGDDDGLAPPVLITEIGGPGQLTGTELLAEDTNGDGALDLLLGSRGVLLGSGDGQFSAPIPVDTAADFSQSNFALFGRLNDDELTDLFITGTPILEAGPR